MRKGWKSLLAILIIMAIILTGCGSSSQSGQPESSTENTTENSIESTSESTAENITDSISDILATAISTTSLVVLNTEFTARDLEVGYEDGTATQIIFDGSNIQVSGDGATFDKSILTISNEGTYVITGTLTNGQIVVDAQDTDKVQIILNGVSITCSNNAPIYIKNADKVFITLEKDTENTLVDGTQYVQADDNNVDGVIYSKADLTINGDGALNITGNYKHGIAAKDELVITGGTYRITAVKDAINGKDCVKIKDGTFTLSATTGNGIQSKNGDDTTKGYVYICGGVITITKCEEGIEGTAIIIEDGTINITAKDDGLNATSGSSDTTDAAATETQLITVTKSDTNTNTNTNTDTNTDTNSDVDATSSATLSETTGETGLMAPGQGQGGFIGGGGGMFENDTNAYISITGGTITVDAQGDGIDSNGSLYIAGGTTYVSGPTNSGNGGLDYNGTAEITGGIIIVAGSTGMAQGFADTSSQYSLLYNLTTESEAGTEIKLTDQEGNLVASYTPSKQYQSVVISTPELKKDATYTFTCGDQTAEITLSSVVTSNGQQGMNFPGGRGGKPDRGSMVKPEDGTFPERTEPAGSN
ncbi:MAG: carbohydrate-binding domain-containing protein [Mobilitalea sp.]